jgi:hypothetical protein
VGGIHVRQAIGPKRKIVETPKGGDANLGQKEACLEKKTSRLTSMGKQSRKSESGTKQIRIIKIIKIDSKIIEIDSLISRVPVQTVKKRCVVNLFGDLVG